MGIRKITFDNGDIVLAKDQAILYDLLLKQQIKKILSNGETIYQNSTGFLIQNESEKLKYTYKNTVYGLELIFNTQLYLSVCGRIIKLEKDTKYLFDWNAIENNKNYYVVVRVDLNKEAKIINGELKEFGNPVEVKLINKKIKLIQDNLNQKPNNGIYEFPLISFIKKYNQDNSWEIKTKDESTYLLLLLMQSSRKPPKLLTITQKIQEAKELLQNKQKQLKDVKNYLTNLEYRKMEELEELENLMKELIKIDKNSRPQIPENSNWKLIPRVNDVLVPDKIIASTDKNKYVKEDDKKYIVIYPYLIQRWNIIKTDAKNINNIWAWSSKAIIYYWDGSGEPELPTINKNTGEITDWK